MRITREIRFSVLNPIGRPANSWAGWPAATRAVPYFTLRATLCGTPDPITGYLCNIQTVDARLREAIAPLTARLERTPNATAEQLLQMVWATVGSEPPPLAGLQLSLTPFLHVDIHAEHPTMVSVTQSFEFSAAHRLYCAGYSEELNHATFGKCANPNGHGHNYRVDVTVRGTPDAHTGQVLPLETFERIVREQVIDRFDHRHLNLDCSEFHHLNPSVENITQVVWNLLLPAFAPAELARVRVWETPKTSAELRA